MTTPVCLLIHAAPQAVQPYERALGIPVTRVYRGTGSGSYDSRAGLASGLNLDAAVAQLCPGADPAAPVVLVGFSAGCWALRAWLRDPAARRRCLAAVFVDGLHASGNDLEAELSSAHDGVIEYGRAALRGERVLVVTHSQIIPPGYASTRATAEAVLQALDVYRPSRHTDFHAAGLHVISGAGADGSAHSAQLMRYGPLACQQHVAPWLEEMAAVADTDPAPPPVDLDASLQVRALQWCLAEAARWGDQKVPAARVREYLSGCVRRGKPLGLTRGNFCCGAQGFAEGQVQLAGEQLPPWRAGAREPMQDAKAGIRGAWHPIARVRETGYLPPPGSLAIYWRVSPTDWRGHIERVIECRRGEGVFEAVGANESGGKWVIETTPLAHERLLGFVVDEEPPPEIPEPLVEPPQDFAEHELTETERQNILALAGLTAQQSFEGNR